MRPLGCNLQTPGPELLWCRMLQLPDFKFGWSGCSACMSLGLSCCDCSFILFYVIAIMGCWIILKMDINENVKQRQFRKSTEYIMYSFHSGALPRSWKVLRSKQACTCWSSIIMCAQKHYSGCIVLVQNLSITWMSVRWEVMLFLTLFNWKIRNHGLEIWLLVVYIGFSCQGYLCNLESESVLLGSTLISCATVVILPFQLLN